MTAKTELTSSSRANPLDYLPVRGEDTRRAPGDFAKSVHLVAEFVEKQGFVFEPWQIAAFVTAARTKPFVILAGISGTGKTKLTGLVAKATGSHSFIQPVRPDWTDSSELLGFERIDGKFVPGPLLRVAKRAADDPDAQYFFVLDEMNIARVEYYLAEVLSLMEERERSAGGSLESPPLAPSSPPDREGTDWSKVVLPENLCLVGSVNMDETTHGFSRKVLDRAFVLEFSDVDLSNVGAVEAAKGVQWPVKVWTPRYLSLAEYPEGSDPAVLRVIETLADVNECLEVAQLQVGYRVRDEIALFCVNARDCYDSFVTGEDQSVDPLDLAIAMKALPRIQGGGQSVRTVLLRLLKWAVGEGNRPPTEGDPTESEDSEQARFPLCARRLRMMLARHDEAGFASYWL